MKQPYRPAYHADQHREKERKLVFLTALHKLRTQAGLSQMQLALEAECCESMIARLERGERHPSLAMCERLARVLSHHLMRHVSLEEFRMKE